MRIYIIVLILSILILLYLIDTYRKFPAKTINLKRVRFLVVLLFLIFIIGDLVWIFLPYGSSWLSKGRGKNEGDDTRQSYQNSDGIIIEINGDTIIVDSTKYIYSLENKGTIQNEITKKIFNYEEILLIDNYASSATYHFVEDIVYSNFDTSNISITSIE